MNIIKLALFDCSNAKNAELDELLESVVNTHRTAVRSHLLTSSSMCELLLPYAETTSALVHTVGINRLRIGRSVGRFILSC